MELVNNNNMNTKINPLRPKIVPRYQDSSNQTHETKLACLVANKRIALRGIINSDALVGRQNNFTADQVVALLDRNAKEIADTARKFDAAINRERVKGAAAVKE